MKMRAVLAVVPLFVVAACGSGGTADSSTTSTAASGTGTEAASSSAAATLGPDLPPATVVAEPVDEALLPTVSGGFGDKPTLTFPDGDPVPSLQRQILVEGDGPVAEVGNTVVVNYYGVVWGGTEPFDNSYDRGAPFDFAIGGQVITGWSIGLEGVAAGSRVLLSIPAENGYGATGSGEAIPGGATLAFVVDVIDVFATDATGQQDAAAQEQDPALPQISGTMAEQPTITVPADAVEPTEVVVEVVNLGTGEPVKEGSLMAQMVLTDWTQTQTQSTWPTEENEASGAPVGPQKLTIPAPGTSDPAAGANPLESLIGVPLGSRVLVLVPGTPADAASGAAAVPATVVAMDLVGQF